MIPSQLQESGTVQIPRTIHATTRDAFTLTELLVVVAVLSVLTALLLPAIAHGTERAHRTDCANNQRQLVLTATAYAHNDREGRFAPPDHQFWPMQDENYLQRFGNLPIKVFICPSTKNGPPSCGLSGYTNGTYIETFYPILVGGSAGSRDATIGASYDILNWFADMENYWNGNDNAEHNSRFVPKTLSSINNYAHKHEAFGLSGKSVGAAAIWLTTDGHVHGGMWYPSEEGNHGVDGANIAFADGHGEWIKPSDFVLKYETSQDNNRTKAFPRPRL